MENVKSVLLIAPTDRKFKISFTCDDSKSDLELIRKNFEDICRKDFALRQIFDSSESHFIFKKYDSLFKCEIEVTDTDIVEHGSVLHVTIISTILADITLSQTSPALSVQQEAQKSEDVILPSLDVVPISSCCNNIVKPKPQKAIEYATQAQKAPEKAVFHIVKFLDSAEVDIVPKLWLNKEQKMCAFPSYKSAIKLAQAVKTSQQVGKDWKKRAVKSLKAFETYEVAVISLPEAERVYVNTEKPEKVKRSKRRRPYIITYNEDDDDDDSSTFKCPRRIETIKQEYIATDDRVTAMSYSFSDILLHSGINPNFQIQNVQNNYLFGIPKSPPSNLDELSEEFEMSCNECKSVILKMLLEIKQRMQLNTYLINQVMAVRGINPVRKFDMPSYPPPFKLPLNSFEEIEAFNKYLERADNFSSSCNYFTTFAGITTQETVKLLLQELISGDTAIIFNWKGRGYKRPFKEMKKICELIYYSTKNNPRCKDTAITEVYNHIKTWFRYAFHRKERKELRLKNSKANRQKRISMDF